MDSVIENPEIDFLHEIGTRIAAADPLHEVLDQIVNFVSALVKCDSCFVYVLEADELVLRASKNPHPEIVGRLKVRVGQGITGWVAEHRQPVAVPRNASQDPRFKFFSELPEDRVPAVYLSWANSMFLAYFAFNRINKLCIVKGAQASDSPRLHHSFFLKEAGTHGTHFPYDSRAEPELTNPEPLAEEGDEKKQANFSAAAL